MMETENGPALPDEIQKRTGIRIEIIDSKREAELILENKSLEIAGPDDKVLSVDVGGGSTEITALKCERIVASHSFDIGSIKLANDLVSDDEWRRMET
jgi:exopolyphosphatase/guanosine-5'-triphosphate,3'-diphosphate pyrophosphatase